MSRKESQGVNNIDIHFFCIILICKYKKGMDIIMKRIGFLGPQGTFSHEAADEYIKKVEKILNCIALMIFQTLCLQ